ncbi:Ger(x)C family spore germination protein [Heyndrickxia sp. NPDC080065]|uniref:Ger(x)C family spore germination protein n=1 Tax=Heyndrickxia sp. NPDC080065 TaxID=3390568 RepID=UPI003CFD53CE
MNSHFLFRFKRKNVILLLIFLVTIQLLHGCSDAIDPERLSYAYGIGVDYQDNEYIIYVQLINLSLLAKTNGPTSNENQLIIGQAKGKNVEAAFFNLYHSSQRHIYWGKLSFFIVTENLLKTEGIRSVVDIFNRFPDIRYQTNIFSTTDSLSEILSATPTVYMSAALSKLGDPENTFKQSSHIQPLDLRKLILSMDEPNYQAFIPHINLNKSAWKSDQKEQPTFDLSGVSIYDKNKKFLGIISGKDIDGYRWLSKKFERSPLFIHEKGRPIASIVINKAIFKIKPIKKKTKYIYQISVKASATLSEIDKIMDISKLKNLAEKNMKQEIVRTYKKSLEQGSDIFQLSHHLYRKDVKAWKKISTNGTVPLNEDSIQLNIKIKIKNTGTKRGNVSF